MPGAAQSIFSTTRLRADLYSVSEKMRAEVCVITFTERGNQSLDGPGFGTDFLLSQGCDVIAVKNLRDDWYAGLTPEHVSLVRMAAARHAIRATYGSSMGAFAAIRFAKALDVSRVLAISPILDVRQDWDTRYRHDLPEMIRVGYDTQDPMIAPDHVDAQIAYQIAYDPYCREDKQQAALLRSLVRRCDALEVPFGGHPVGPALRDAALLSKFAASALKLGKVAQIDVSAMQDTPWVRHARVRYLLERQKLKSALVVSKHALEQSPQWSEAQLVHAQILERLGEVDEAIPFAEEAIRLEPKSPYFVAIVAEFLEKHGRCELASQLVREGLGRIGKVDILVSAAQRLDRARTRQGPA